MKEIGVHGYGAVLYYVLLIVLSLGCKLQVVGAVVGLRFEEHLFGGDSLDFGLAVAVCATE